MGPCKIKALVRDHPMSQWWVSEMWLHFSQSPKKKKGKNKQIKMARLTSPVSSDETKKIEV